MKKHYKGMVFLLVLILVMSIGASVMAANIGQDVVDNLQSSGEGVMGKGVMNTVGGLSKDIFNIVRYVVIASLVIKAFSIFSQFSNAGDNPQLKASLKGRLLWTAGGLVLALNFWGLYNFLSNSIKLGF